MPAAAHVASIPAEALLPPVVCLLFVMSMFMLIGPDLQWNNDTEYCIHGMAIGPQTIPDLAGPDRPSGVRMLRLRPGAAQYYSEDVTSDTFRDLLRRYPIDAGKLLTLHVHRDLPLRELRGYLRVLRAEGYTELSLIVRRIEPSRFYRNPYTAIRASLQPGSRREGVRPVVAFDSSSYNELARAAIEVRRSRPVARIDLDQAGPGAMLLY